LETLLIHLLVGLIVFGVIFALITLVLPQLGLPAWITQAVRLVLAAIFLIWLLYLLLPLVRTAF
jgi:hypothetical protein